VENIQRITEHIAGRLRAEGVTEVERRVLTLLHTPGGQTYHQDAGGGIWRLYRFIENTETYETMGTPAQANEAARAFGAFQALLADLEGPRLHETIPRFHDTPHRYLALDDAITNDSRGRAAGAAREIEFARRRRRACGVLHDLWRDGHIPERVVHNDAKLGNVLFDATSGQGICVIDLDTVMAGLSVHDFGDMVRTMTTRSAEDEPEPAKVTLDLSLFEAVARGYLESTATMLTHEERLHLVTAGRLITLEQGVRFLTDHLQGDAYYPTTRSDHNLDRCRTQFRLVELIEESAERMQRIVETA
jgi:aminoglycoside phosphotransferase (APT) family kinase protein